MSKAGRTQRTAAALRLQPLHCRSSAAAVRLLRHLRPLRPVRRARRAESRRNLHGPALTCSEKHDSPTRT